MTVRKHLLGQDSTEQDSRLGLAALFTRTTGVAVASGVLHGLETTQTGSASASVSVAAGRAVVQASSAIGGAYLGTNDSALSVNVLGTNPAESSPRRDLIVFRPSTAEIYPVKGVAAAVPVDPATPAETIAIARVRVKTAVAYGGTEVIVNADIDDLRTYTALQVSGDPLRPFYDPPRAKIYLGSSIGLPNNNTLTFVQDTLWGSAGTRTGTGHKIVIPTAGIYDIKAQVVFDTNATGRRIVQVRRNAATVSTGGTQVAAKERSPISTGNTIVDVHTEFALSAGDHLELFAYQNSGGSLTLGGGVEGTYLSARWVAPLP